MASKPAAGRSPGEKRKRVVLTLKEKMDICRRLERGESRKALMQEYNVGMSTLYDIRAHKAQLLRFLASSDSDTALARRRTLHTPKLEPLDRELYEWFLAQRSEGVPVSGPMLIAKARDFYEQMQLTEPCVFSGGWLWRFKARHGIRKLDASSERHAADHQAAERFCGFFRSLTAEHGLSPEQVYNADETGLFWRCVPGARPGAEAAPGPRPHKDRLTVLMCANATGSHRLKPLVVGKCGGPRAAQGLQHLPVVYKAQGSAWVDREMFSDWFHHIFVPAVKEHFRAVALPENSKAVLLLGGSRAPPREAELVSENVLTVFLPPGVTALLQPMDQGIRRDFMRHFVAPRGRLQAFMPRGSVRDAVLGVACAWDAVPGSVFSRAWRKLWPEAALAEGSSSEEEPERLRTQPPDPAFAHAPGLVGGSAAAGSPEPAEPAEPEDGDEEAWEQAAAAFDAVVRFAEGQPCFSAQEVGQLRALRSTFSRRWQARPRGALGAAVEFEVPWERAGPRGTRPRSPRPGSSTAGEA